jgi:hypothetical protein
MQEQNMDKACELLRKAIERAFESEKANLVD